MQISTACLGYMIAAVVIMVVGVAIGFCLKLAAMDTAELMIGRGYSARQERNFFFKRCCFYLPLVVGSAVFLLGSSYLLVHRYDYV